MINYYNEGDLCNIQSNMKNRGNFSEKTFV